MSVAVAIKSAARWAALGLTLAIFGPLANAQQPSPAAMASAKELISITGATTLFSPLIAGVVEQAKVLYLQQNPALAKDLNEIATQMRADLQPRFHELTEEVARLYATNFTEQELKDILAFYKTTAGKKLLATQPKIVDSSMKFAQDWANTLSDQVIAKMRDELKKRGHAL
ncbi:MAG TPA: DUF2059 domain-containing protein [Pseudolabrys sp.]|jgi:hypothetical protein|nr:DUF2059 domain-containing protein [Pseudolabrys sp.]